MNCFFQSEEKIHVDLDAKPTTELGEFFVIDKSPRDLNLFRNRDLAQPANPFRSTSQENLSHGHQDDARSDSLQREDVRRNLDTKVIF